MDNNKVSSGVLDLTEYDELVNARDTEMIDVFSSHIIHVKMRTAYTGVRLNVMTQALHAEDGSLPQGLMIQNTSTEMCDGSKNVTVIVQNSTAYSQTLRKKIPVARVVVATLVPEPPMQTGMIEALDEAQGFRCQSWLWSKSRKNCSRS